MLFNSDDQKYRKLHAEMISYLKFLKEKSKSGQIRQGLVESWYTFPEVKQTWLGYSRVGNAGSGLGPKFANDLNRNLHTIFSNFGHETITKGSHLEKLCLVSSGVGRDNISDFTTNLIKHYLLDYTETFALKHISREMVREFNVERVSFSYETESWVNRKFTLPCFQDDYVLLTPRNILTKDEVWISKVGLLEEFSDVLHSIPNHQLRDQLNNYLLRTLPKDHSRPEWREAVYKTIQKYPESIEYYIRFKEDHGDEATDVSRAKVREVHDLFVDQASELIEALSGATPFYRISGNTREEALRRVEFLKDVVENKGGHRMFYSKGAPITRESDLHILYRLTWFGTPSDVSTEVNDGRGPADYKVSRGSSDKTIVEFKLASNSKLKRSLKAQVEIYKAASDAEHGLYVIFFFSDTELRRIESILTELQLLSSPNIILIDARDDNKPSGSKAA